MSTFSPPAAWTILCEHCGRLKGDHMDFGSEHSVCPPVHAKAIRRFGSGATRNLDDSKLDYEGFISPEVLHRFAEYMQSHRKQKDGTLRDSDNWQKGIPIPVYHKSLVRHTMDLWRLMRGYKVTDPDTDKEATKEELCCAIMFNVMGLLHELLKTNNQQEVRHEVTE